MWLTQLLTGISPLMGEKCSQGRLLPLALPLTPCGMAAITRPWFLFPLPPDASCSCISCCPTGFPQRDAAGRTPASVLNSRPGKRPLPWFCAGSLGSDAQWRCLFGSSSSVRMESHSRSGFPQCQPLLSLQPPAASWPSAR